MNSIKCPQCNLTNWATAPSCKRCGFGLQGNDSPMPPNASSFASPTTLYNQPPPNRNPPNPHYVNGQNFNPPPMNQKTGLAIASIVLGVIGCFITAPISLIMGIVAIKRVNRDPYNYGGKGMAIAGIILSVIQLISLPFVAAIAIPNLLAARKSANEASAIATMKKLTSAESTYRNTMGMGNYGDIDKLADAGLIDPQLKKGYKNGYVFIVTVNPQVGSTTASSYTITAKPLVSEGMSASGTRSFFSTFDGDIHYSNIKGVLADKSNDILDTGGTRVPNGSPNLPTTSRR
jgi:type IV pilus assembly protein PilA